MSRFKFNTFHTNVYIITIVINMRCRTFIGYLLVIAIAGAGVASAQSDDAAALDSTVATDAGHQQLMQRNFTDFMQIRDVLNVFSVEHIGQLWPEFSGQLSGPCATDLLEYLQALEQGAMWAMQSKCALFACGCRRVACG